MLSKFSVKKPYTVIVGLVLIVVLGIVSFQRMTTDLLPDINLPYAIVITAYPGASPSQVEEAVADGTIGEKLVSIEDVLSMYPVLTCTPEGDRLLNNGNPIPEELVQGDSREEKVRMYKSSGNFTGIYGWDERKQKYVPIRMFFV